jgi:4-amino-4-deoxy-L-arabinose transferase-like glycosyltransferase
MILAIALLLVGIGYRFYLVLKMPVGYDEVFVMSVGLEEMSRSAADFLIEVPVKRSSGITPLWWWLEYVPVRLGGGISLATLRVLPFLLGAGTMLLAYALARRFVGRRMAMVFLGLLCLSDVVAFTNSRSDFSESLSLPIIVALVCLAARRGFTLTRGLLLLVLMMTGLGKGILVAGLLILAEGFVIALVPRERVRRALALFAALLIAVVPTLGYLLWANAHFAASGTIDHDAVQASNIFDLIHKLTLEYSQVKAHVTGSVRDAAQVYLDFAVWPVTVVTAVPLLAGILAAWRRLFRARFRPRSRRDRQAAALLVWAVVGAAVIILRGSAGARFHLMYLPAAWMLCAMWIGRRGTIRSLRRILPELVATAVFVAMATGWTDWAAGRVAWPRVFGFMVVLVPIAAAGAWALTRAPRLARTAGPIALGIIWLVCIVSAGPAKWAPYARFEPMYGSEELAALDDYRSGRRAQPPQPHGRTLYVDLAHYYLTTQPATDWSRAKALDYARREVARDETDARAWFYLGLALQENNAPVEEVRRAWERSLQLKPSDVVERYLAELPSK